MENVREMKNKFVFNGRKYVAAFAVDFVKNRYWVTLEVELRENDFTRIYTRLFGFNQAEWLSKLPPNRTISECLDIDNIAIKSEIVDAAFPLPFRQLMLAEING